MSPEQKKLFNEGVYYYNTSTCNNSGSASGTSTAITGETTGPAAAVQQVVWNTLTSGGIDPLHTAAVMGNIAIEGVWDPESVENLPGLPPRSQDPTAAGQYGYGLIGWTPGSSLLDQMKEAGITGKPYTAETQSAVILAEIQGKTPNYYPADLGKQFLNTKTIEDATSFYEGPGGFENPADPAATRQDRIASAKDFLQKFSGTSAANPSTITSSSSCSCPGQPLGSSLGNTNLSGNTPAQQAYNFFVSKGVSSQGAAGLVGNFMSESGGDTENLDPSITNSIGAHGIAQWLGGRLSSLKSYAQSHSEKEDDLNTQLEFSWYELNSDYKSVLDKIKNASSASQAASTVNSDYEVSGVDPSTREANAQKILNKYGGGDISIVSDSSCSGSPASSSGYTNPFRDWKNLIDNRVDQGVDYSGVGPIYAIGNGTIDYASTSTSWPGGNFVSYKLSDGPAAGKEIYVAEDCALENGISHGKPVSSNTVLCTTHTAGGYIYIETGWAAPGIDNSIDTALQPGCYDINNSTSTAFGMNFRDLMKSLGVKSNNEVDKPITCTLPGSWPTWQ